VLRVLMQIVSTIFFAFKLDYESMCERLLHPQRLESPDVDIERVLGHWVVTACPSGLLFLPPTEDLT
jgi:hypothetical protein